MVTAARVLGLEIRVGRHTGEVEPVHGCAHGFAVHAAARVMSLAGATEVPVSWTTRELLARLASGDVGGVPRGLPHGHDDGGAPHTGRWS
jgi:class 3 adenylate cyclase